MIVYDGQSKVPIIIFESNFCRKLYFFSKIFHLLLCAAMIVFFNENGLKMDII